MMETLQQGYGIPQGYAGTIGVGGPQIGQQGLWGNPQATQFGAAQAAPFGGMLTSGIAGLFGSQNVPRQFGIGGGLDPVTAAYAQQAQLAQLLPQTLLGHNQGIFGTPLQNIDPVTATLLQQAQLARQFGQPFGASQYGLQRPIGLDPLTIACLQQAQLVQQQVQLAQLLHQAQIQQQLAQQYGGQQFGQFGRSPFQNPFQNPLQGVGQMGGGYGQGIPWQ